MKKTTLSATLTTEYDNLDPALGQAETMEGTSLNNGILYLGKQQDLYLYARLGWRNYLPHQLVFKAFSPYYTEALAAEQLALIELTEALPDQEARVVEPLDAKDELVGLNTNVLQKFMDGKLYIERTYTDPTKQATMLRAAGDNYYKAAFDKNWSSTARCSWNSCPSGKRWKHCRGPKRWSS